MKNKHFLIVLTAFFTTINASAQPIIKQQKTVGGNRDDYFTTICLTSDGGFIEGGYSLSDLSGEKTQNFKGGYDYWVVKFDKHGHIQWDKTIGGSNDDYLSVVKQSSDGGYMLGGYSKSPKFADKSEDSRGAEDFWIVKLDNAGNILWDKTIGGSLGDYLSDLQQTSDGGYILGGYSSGPASGEKTENGKGLYDFWIVKIDGSGNIKWDKTIGGTDIDQLTCLQQTSDGGYMLGGFSESNISFDKTENNRGLHTADYWIVKVDGSGNVQWDKTIGGKKDDLLTGMQQTFDGGYILGGWSSSNIFGEKTQASRGLVDYWIVKTDAGGNIQWDKTIGGSSNDELATIKQTTDSGYIFGGNSLSNMSGEKTENSKGNNDYWIVKTNSAGAIEWDKSIGGSSADFLKNIIEISKNKYLLGGYSTSDISGDKTEISRGGIDYWTVLLVDRPGSIKATSLTTAALSTTEKNILLPFQVYPNPVKNILHIHTDASTALTFTDQSGKIIFNKTIKGNDEINITRLPAGIYYLRNIETKETEKVLILK